MIYKDLPSDIVIEKLSNPDLPDRRGIDLKPITLHSAFKAVQQYDSNIFLDNSSVRGDFVTVLTPSIGFDMKLGKGALSADYEFAEWIYWTYHEQAHLDHRLRVLGEMPIGNFKFTLSDNFRIFTDRASNEESLRLKENINNFRAGVSTQMDQFGFDLGYTNRLRVYDSNDIAIGSITYDQESYMTNMVDGTVSYLIMPKTRIFFENDIGFNRYYETSQLPDSWFDNVLVGFKGKWRSKVTIDIKGGLRYQSYDYSDLISHKSWIGPVIMGGVMYEPTKRGRFILSLERINHESTYSVNNYYTVNFAGLKYKHKFTKKWSADIFGNYQLHLYPSQTTENGITAKRSDNIFNFGTGLRYDMQEWASFELTYNFMSRDCNFDVYNYKDNVVMVRGTIGF